MAVALNPPQTVLVAVAHHARPMCPLICDPLVACLPTQHLLLLGELLALRRGFVTRGLFCGNEIQIVILNSLTLYHLLVTVKMALMAPQLLPQQLSSLAPVPRHLTLLPAQPLAVELRGAVA